MTEEKKEQKTYIENTKRASEIETELRSLLSKGKTENSIILKFGSIEYKLQGNFLDLQKILDSAMFEKLKKVKSTNERWYSWSEDYKGLLKDELSNNVYYLESCDSVTGEIDVDIQSMSFYSSEDAKKIELLQIEYKNLVKEKKSKETKE
jgi:hypothetical protein